MKTPAKPRVTIIYIPRDSMKIREVRLIGGWQGEFREVDVQLEMFTDAQTGADLPITEEVVIAVDSLGTGPAYRISDYESPLWRQRGLAEEDLPRPVAFLHESGLVEGYAREWQAFEGCLAAYVIAEVAQD